MCVRACVCGDSAANIWRVTGCPTTRLAAATLQKKNLVDKLERQASRFSS